MSLQSEYVRRMNALYINGFDDGQRCGQQQAFDAATIFLARKGWTGKELVEFFNGCIGIVDEFHDAYNPGQEQDVAQERMDADLEAAYEGEVEFLPFRERYPAVKNLGYDKPIKEQRHPAAKKRGKRK